ncbi:1852_t:CDS:2, partial [Gigaspora rosea]
YSHNMGKDSFNKLVNIQWALNEMDIEIEQCDHKNDNNDIWECVMLYQQLHQDRIDMNKKEREIINRLLFGLSMDSSQFV